MGQELTLTTQTNNTEFHPDFFIESVFPIFQVVKVLSQNVLCSTLLIQTKKPENEKDDEESGQPFIMKVFPKFEGILTSYESHIEKLKELKLLLSKRSQYPNILPILQVFEIPQAVLVLRQYLPDNLTLRLGNMPYLSLIEKKWICFQIIYSVCQLHKIGKCHGDIKLNNILLSSYMSVFLTDISTYKPTYIKSDDLNTYTTFFSNNFTLQKPCYIAPERFDDNAQKLSQEKLKPEMDVFSIGVVIAEIFLETPLFTHSTIIDYKKGNYNISKKLDELLYDKLKELLLKMIDIDPKKRIKLMDVLEFFASEICPSPITGFLVHINVLVICYDYYQGDRLICLIYQQWNNIWSSLFKESGKKIPKLKSKLSFLSSESIKQYKSLNGVYLENFSLMFLENPPEKAKKTSLESSECSRIILNFIINAMENAKYYSNILIAIEMIEKLSYKMKENQKIEYVIPYLTSLLSIKNHLVKVTSFNTIIRILDSVKEEKILLSSFDFFFFTDYLFDKFCDCFYTSTVSFKIEFISKLDILLNLQLKFTVIKFKTFEKNSNSNSFLRSSLNEYETKIKSFIKSNENEQKKFKEKIFEIIKYIIYDHENEHELVLVFIRMIPRLVLLFDEKELVKFKDTLLIIMNRNNYRIRRELFKIFPSLVLSLGDLIINDFIYYIDVIITAKMNEMVIYEMIHSVTVCVGLIQREKLLEIYGKMFFYIKHPNILIRNKLILLGESIINLVPQEELYAFLWKDVKNCGVKFSEISIEVISRCAGDFYDRCSFSLVKYYMEFTFDKSLEERIRIFVNPLKNGDPTAVLRYSKEMIAANTKVTSIQQNLRSIVKDDNGINFLSKFESYYNNQDGPKISQKIILFTFIIKHLNIIVDWEKISLYKKNQDKNLKNGFSVQSYISEKKTNPKSFWRPQGISIHTNKLSDTEVVIKLIPLTGGKFISITNNATVYYHEINDNKEIIFIKTVFNVSYSNPIFRNAISSITMGNNTFLLLGIKNDLKVIDTNLQKDLSLPFSEEILSISDYSEQLSFFLLCDIKNTLYSFDIINKVIKHLAKITNKIGLITSISTSNHSHQFLLGTSRGILALYDSSLNCINDYFVISKYEIDTPISGIQKFSPKEKNIYDLNTLNCDDDLFFIYTNMPDHDISLWNLTTLNCELMFKVDYFNEKEAEGKIGLEKPPKIEKKKLEEIECSNMLIEKYTTILGNPEDCHIVKALYYSGDPFIITCGTDTKIRYWSFMTINQKYLNEGSYVIKGFVKSDEENDFGNEAAFSNLSKEKTNVIKCIEKKNPSAKKIPLVSITDFIKVTLNEKQIFFVTANEDGSIKLWK